MIEGPFPAPTVEDSYRAAVRTYYADYLHIHTGEIQDNSYLFGITKDDQMILTDPDSPFMLYSQTLVQALTRPLDEKSLRESINAQIRLDTPSLPPNLIDGAIEMRMNYRAEKMYDLVEDILTDDHMLTYEQKQKLFILRVTRDVRDPKSHLGDYACNRILKPENQAFWLHILESLHPSDDVRHIFLESLLTPLSTNHSSHKSLWFSACVDSPNWSTALTTYIQDKDIEQVFHRYINKTKADPYAINIVTDSYTDFLVHSLQTRSMKPEELISRLDKFLQLQEISANSHEHFLRIMGNNLENTKKWRPILNLPESRDFHSMLIQKHSDALNQQHVANILLYGPKYSDDSTLTEAAEIYFQRLNLKYQVVELDGQLAITALDEWNTMMTYEKVISLLDIPITPGTVKQIIQNHLNGQDIFFGQIALLQLLIHENSKLNQYMANAIQTIAQLNLSPLLLYSAN